jgi:hypothetical protein
VTTHTVHLLRDIGTKAARLSGLAKLCADLTEKQVHDQRLSSATENFVRAQKECHEAETALVNYLRSADI